MFTLSKGSKTEWINIDKPHIVVLQPDNLSVMIVGFDTIEQASEILSDEYYSVLVSKSDEIFRKLANCITHYIIEKDYFTYTIDKKIFTSECDKILFVVDDNRLSLKSVVIHDDVSNFIETYYADRKDMQSIDSDDAQLILSIVADDIEQFERDLSI